MEKLEIEIKRKFIKDTNLPIQVLESPYFEYFLNLYEPTLGSKTLWASLQKEISDSFDGKPGKWMEYTRSIQDKVIFNILETPEYKKFNEDKELNKILSETPGEMRGNIYSGGKQGKIFLSVDLKKANFQAFHWYNPKIVLGEDTWEEFLSHYTTSPSFISSKNLRQVVFGKTNPSRLTRVEKYLTWKITELISPLLPENTTLISRMTDEAIWELPGSYIPTGEIEEKTKILIKNSLGVDIKVEVFGIDMIQRFTHTGESILGFIKDFAYPSDKMPELKGVPKMYYPQIYKAWKGLDLNPTYDLVIYHEGELSHFDYPLSFINPNYEKETKNDILSE